MNRRLRNFLEKEQISYYHQYHAPVFAAKDVATEEHISTRVMAKTVVIKADGQYALAVIPAASRIDVTKLKTALGVKHARLASEIEFTAMFPDCEIGAMPPFGNLYDVPVYCEASLAKDKEIVFNAGTHADTIRIKFSDFTRLAQPRILAFATDHAA